MKQTMWWVLVLSAVVWAEPMPPPQTARGTLGGQSVVVVLVPDRSTEYVGTFTLEVRNNRGKVLWSSHADHFNWGPAGEEQLQMVGDVQGNGQPEVVLSDPRSDVSAPTFRFYEWQNGGLVLKHHGRLIEGHGEFRYSNDNVGHGVWIATFLSAANGRATVAVEGMRKNVVHGTAVVHGDANGFSLVQYSEPLHPTQQSELKRRSAHDL